MSDNQGQSGNLNEPGWDNSLRMTSIPKRHPILERIMTEAIEDPTVGKYRNRAQFTFFCGAEPEQLSGYDGQLEIAGRCLEWFVFDCVIPELGMTPGQFWLTVHGQGLSQAELTAGADCLNFVQGLYEITHVVPDKGFTACNLLEQEKLYKVYEQVICNEIEAGQLVISRLFPINGKYCLSGMAVLMNSYATEDIKGLIDCGKLIPEDILPMMDGVELENLFGRSLHDIEMCEDILQIRDSLWRYADSIYPGVMSGEELDMMIREANDAVDLSNTVKKAYPPFNRHEQELVLTLVLTLWNMYHPV